MRLLVLALLLIVAGCGGGKALPPSNGGNNPPQDNGSDPPPAGNPPSGGGVPAPPDDDDSPAIGLIEAYQDGGYSITMAGVDAGRLPTFSLLDADNKVVRTQPLTWRGNMILDGSHPIEPFRDLKLGTYTLAITYFDSKWGSEPLIFWESPAIELTLDRPAVTGLRYDTRPPIGIVRYQVFAKHPPLPSDPPLRITVAYKIHGDDVNRFWIHGHDLGGIPFSQYVDDGAPVDLRNSGDPIQTLAVPQGSTVTFGWYEVSTPPDNLDPFGTIDELVPIVEAGPIAAVPLGQDGPITDLVVDFTIRGEPEKTR